jgi:iron donor protein CyaY
MTDSEFMDRAETLLKAVEGCCDRINDDSDADVDNQRVGGMVTLTFANRSQIIINLQKPLHEVWMAAKSGGYHYRFDGHAWLDSAAGTRASGLGYVGGPSGGVAFGIRNFWQSHPAQLDIRGADKDAATVTLWVWAPDAPPMDLRFYHDGLGQDTYEKQYKGGLEITYEDYEPGFGTPMGVARTSEMRLWVLPATPERARFADLADALRQPAVLVATPQTTVESGVFGHALSLPSQTPSEHSPLEKQQSAWTPWSVAQICRWGRLLVPEQSGESPPSVVGATL